MNTEHESVPRMHW